MQRKRARKQNASDVKIESKRMQNQIVEEKKKHFKINKQKAFIAFSLIAIFFLVLFFNSYFNYMTPGSVYNPDGDTLGTRFFLSGPDPYYNMRTVQYTYEHGYYPFVGPADKDPLLSYPAYRGGSRPPLMNMMAVGSATVLSNFMSEIDALGWSMLFIPAIFGALLVFPVYGIGKEIFNKKAGLIAALLVAIIPVHIGSGHGSALSLFDHDALLLFLYTVAFYFIIKMLKEQQKIRSILFAAFAGLAMGAISLVWVTADSVYAITLITLFVITFFEIIRSKNDLRNTQNYLIAYVVAFLIQLPYVMVTTNISNFAMYAVLISTVILVFRFLINKLKMPWLVSIPSTMGLFVMGISFLYLVQEKIIVLNQYIFSPIYTAANMIFGTGIYGNKVDLTIAEAGSFNMSQTVMSIGPAVYWLGWVGLIFLIWKIYKEKFKAEHVFYVTIFFMETWLLTTSGRFINDQIPGLVVLAGFVIWFIIEKIDYRQMVKNIKNAGGGYRGLRRGLKVTHILGLGFIVFLVIMPNTLLALDSATPTFPITTKYAMFGEDWQPAWGNNNYKSIYWADACNYLSKQDNEIANPGDRPGFISWWDYGFYESSMGGHPTVADNYQSGIEPAANFQTAATEEEAVAVLIVRIAAGRKYPLDAETGKLTNETKDVFYKYLPDWNETKVEYNNITKANETINITHKPAEDAINIMESPIKYAPSYDTLIGPQWNNTILRVSWSNAMYHDLTKILTERLDDEGITNMYLAMINATGYSIRYYGVEGYDARDIFGVFTFLADKGVHGQVTYEDDYFITVYQDTTTGKEYTIPEINNMSSEEIQKISPNLKTVTHKKEAFFNTMVYKAYYGIYFGNEQFPETSYPTYGLKHFVPVHVTQMPYPGTQVPAVVIAKYYAGAKINGTVFVGDTPFAGATIYAMDEYFGLPHDVGIVTNEGSFELHAPAGNITLHAFLENNDLGNRIEFNTTENPPITEDEAMRAVQSNRSVKFQINYSSVDGMINGTENETKLTLKIKNENYNNIEYTQDVTKGEYAFKDLIPSTYRFIITNTTGVEIYNETTFLKPDNNTYNITCTYPPYSPKTINVTEADDNRTIVMKNSDKINLTLLDTDPGNYRWNLTSVNQSAWSLVDRFNSTWILSAKTVGNTSIEAVYEERNNTMNVTKRFAFNFIVEEKPEH